MSRLQPPTKCDECSFVDISYGLEKDLIGTNIRLWPFIYYCPHCKAVVGCHPGTDQPLGYMASAYVRRLRAELHDLIDPIWQKEAATRTEVYTWLAGLINVRYEDFHISQLRVVQLKALIEFVQAERHNFDLQRRQTNSNQSSEADRSVRSKYSRRQRFSRRSNRKRY